MLSVSTQRRRQKIVTNSNHKEATLNSGLPPYNLGPFIGTAATVAVFSVKSKDNSIFTSLTYDCFAALLMDECKWNGMHPN